MQTIRFQIPPIMAIWNTMQFVKISGEPFFPQVLPHDAYAKHKLCHGKMSVCLSVTHRYWV